MDYPDDDTERGNVRQDDLPTGDTAGGSSWDSQVDDVPEVVGPDTSMPRVPPPLVEEQNNRDHDSWRESLRQELVLTQGYF